MTRETILLTACDKHMGALIFQAELMKQLSKIETFSSTDYASVFQAASLASDQTAVAIRCWESEQLKKIQNQVTV